MSVNDKAGKAHWDRIWRSSSDHGRGRLIAPGYRTRKQLEYFRRVFAEMPARGRTLLELGCARSEWLVHFSREFGLRVSGVDYSERGCELAREILDRNGIEGEIHCADIFAPPEHLLDRFDYVVSFGLVEHFEDLTGCLTTTAKFLKPGGIAFTCIPNMVGLVGRAQKWLGPTTYSIHMPWTKEDLIDHLKAAGFRVLNAEYVMVHDFANCQVDEDAPNIKLKLAAYKWLKRIAAVAMLGESRLGYYPINRQTASYIYTTGQKA